MFKITFNSVNDVYDFVETFGSTAGLWRKGAIDSNACELINQAVAVSEMGEGTVIHTIFDQYCDNNGHNETVVEIVKLCDEFDMEHIQVVQRNGYGTFKTEFAQYLKESPEKFNANILMKIMNNYGEINRANKLRGMFR